MDRTRIEVCAISSAASHGPVLIPRGRVLAAAEVTGALRTASIWTRGECIIRAGDDNQPLRISL